MRETRNYACDTSLTVTYPWGLYVAGRALCADGKVRTLKRIAQTADTFFSVPASVTVKGRTVAGYISIQTRAGFDTATPDDPAIVRFHAYQYRANGALLPERK